MDRLISRNEAQKLFTDNSPEAIEAGLARLQARRDEDGFMYDPDFPPDVPEGLPLTVARPKKCGNAAIEAAKASSRRVAARIGHVLAA